MLADFGPVTLHSLCRLRFLLTMFVHHTGRENLGKGWNALARKAAVLKTHSQQRIACPYNLDFIAGERSSASKGGTKPAWCCLTTC